MQKTLLNQINQGEIRSDEHCLDIIKDEDGLNLRLEKCHGQLNSTQRWSYNDGLIENVHSGLCLAVESHSQNYTLTATSCGVDQKEQLWRWMKRETSVGEN